MVFYIHLKKEQRTKAKKKKEGDIDNIPRISMLPGRRLSPEGAGLLLAGTSGPIAHP